MRLKLCGVVGLLCINLSAAQISAGHEHQAFKQEAMLLVTLAALGTACAQITAAEDHYDPQTLSFLYFIYVSTWLGNMYGFFDITGWILDWISNWIFYRKGDSPEVLACTTEIEHLKGVKKKKLKLAARLCYISARMIKNNQNEKVVELLSCLKEVVTSEIKDKEDEQEQFKPE